MATKIPGRQRSVVDKLQRPVKDQRISVCVPCRYGIFEGRNDYVYTNTGYAHIRCLEPNEITHAA